MLLKIDIPQLEKAIKKTDAKDPLVTEVLANLEEAIKLGNKLIKYTEENLEDSFIENFDDVDFFIFSISFIISYTPFFRKSNSRTPKWNLGCHVV